MFKPGQGLLPIPNAELEWKETMNKARAVMRAAAMVSAEVKNDLMVDNYDSFTYNVVQYLAELKADVHVYRNDQITIAEIEQLAPEELLFLRGPVRLMRRAYRLRRLNILLAKFLF